MTVGEDVTLEERRERRFGFAGGGRGGYKRVVARQNDGHGPPLHLGKAPVGSEENRPGVGELGFELLVHHCIFNHLRASKRVAQTSLSVMM